MALMSIDALLHALNLQFGANDADAARIAGLGQDRGEQERAIEHHDREEARRGSPSA
jgi:hypothetical protein